MQCNQLIFVYNADSSLFGAFTDFAHKILSPATYNCRLCALTYGNISMKQEWKTFIESLPVKPVFLHKDEFLKNYNLDTVLPAVFCKDKDTIKLFLGKEQIEGCNSVEDLIKLVSGTS